MDAPGLIPQGWMEGGRERKERGKESQCSLLSGCGCFRQPYFNWKITARVEFTFFFLLLVHTVSMLVLNTRVLLYDPALEEQAFKRRMMGGISFGSSVLMQMTGGAHRGFCGSYANAQTSAPSVSLCCLLALACPQYVTLTHKPVDAPPHQLQVALFL